MNHGNPGEIDFGSSLHEVPVIGSRLYVHRISMGTQEDMESTNKGGTSFDWSFGNHHLKT